VESVECDVGVWEVEEEEEEEEEEGIACMLVCAFRNHRLNWNHLNNRNPTTQPTRGRALCAVQV